MTTLLSLVRLAPEEQGPRGLVHTPKEIAQQPDTWGTTFAIFKHEQHRLCSFLEQVGVRAPQADKPVVFLVGAGTSDYIGQALAPLLRKQWQCQVIAIASTDLLPNLDDCIIADTKYLWISFSRSGDSPEGVAIIQQAMERYPEIAHLVVTCNPQAQMIALSRQHANSCDVVLDDAVNDRSLAMTSSFTNMVLMGQCLAHAWSLGTYGPIFEQLQRAGRNVLEAGYVLAEEIAAENLPRLCLVGIGALNAVAKEAALKVLEMSAGQVKTMAETTLGLRHGPMAALDRETVFVCFVSGDARRQGYALDLLDEVGRKQIVAKRIAVGPASASAALTSRCEAFLPLDLDVEDGYRPVVDVIFGQLLGLCAALANDCRPDAPSSGDVITRVVQQFAIYR